MQKKILILFAHPAQRRSEVNVELAKAARALDYVTFVDLYESYPDYFINVDVEQKRLLEHDIIIFLHPVYWYSTPAMLKEWQDLVLEYGFAYGKDGNKLHGKIFFATVSAGGSAQAYQASGSNHFTLRQLFSPLEQTASLCGMTYLPPYALMSARRAFEEGRIPVHVSDWLQLLEALSQDRVNLQDAAGKGLLNEAIFERIADSADTGNSQVERQVR